MHQKCTELILHGGKWGNGQEGHVIGSKAPKEELKKIDDTLIVNTLQLTDVSSTNLPTVYKEALNMS